MAQNPPTNKQLAAQLGQLTTIVANLATAINNLTTAGGLNPNPLAQQAAATGFALTPGIAAGDNLINFSTKNGLVLYKAGIEPLPTAFDLKAEQVVIFEKELANKVSSMGWNKGAQNITTYKNQDGCTIDLISEYGQINHQTLKTACENFVMQTGIRGQQRAAQNNKHMWRCINDSITKQAKAKVLSYRDDYEINNNGVKKIAAPLLYKTIMRLATLDSNATNRQLRANLRKLTSYAISENGNTDKIHTYFDQNFTQLKARRQNVDDVHSILFKAYLAIPDAEFNTYMRCLHDDWMDQVGEMKNIKFEQLMQCAKAKYNLLVLMGKWGTKTKEQEEIITLKAQLEGMKDATLQISNKLKKAAGKKNDQNK